MIAHEVILRSSTRAVFRWLRARPHLSSLEPEPGRAERVAVRVLGRVAIRRVLGAAGMPPDVLPSLRDIRISADAFGRPVVGLPARAADWMRSARLGLDLSLAHAGPRLLVVAIAAP